MRGRWRSGVAAGAMSQRGKRKHGSRRRKHGAAAMGQPRDGRWEGSRCGCPRIRGCCHANTREAEPERALTE